jgi:acetoin utilization deacetylase AcuC-like enzyme
MRTGFLYDPIFLEHDTGAGHPECAKRLTASLEHLQQQPWFAQLIPLQARAIDPRWLRQVHTKDYIRRVESACNNGMRYLDTPDVSISRRSYEVALHAAGSGLVLADRLLAGEIDNGFALLRPPGHHAEASMALGFCLFNNIAILARYLQQQHGLGRIAIMDWDVHHGNGTQHAFEADASVFYISIHQYPFYPGSGDRSEAGHDSGRGATLNCPMPAGAGDQDYEQVFRTRILPAIADFQPECILISAGFDAHYSDPLAGMSLSTEFYGWMTQRLLEAADHHSGGRLLSLLEGGYNLSALPCCIAAHLKTLCGSHIDAPYP